MSVDDDADAEEVESVEPVESEEEAESVAEVDEEDLAIIDTYKLFGCESGEPDFQFDLARGINEGFLAPYKPIALISSLVEEAYSDGSDHV